MSKKSLEDEQLTVNNCPRLHRPVSKRVYVASGLLPLGSLKFEVLKFCLGDTKNQLVKEEFCVPQICMCQPFQEIGEWDKKKATKGIVKGAAWWCFVEYGSVV